MILFYNSLAVILILVAGLLAALALVLGFVFGIPVTIWAILTAPEDPQDIAARERRKRINTPYCFGSHPGPQAQAENDCTNCVHRNSCFSIGNR